MTTEQSSMDKPMIPINKPWLDEEDKNEVMNVLNENQLQKTEEREYVGLSLV